MRIAYIGGDSYARCALALLEDGHTITHVFSSAGPAASGLRLSDVAKRAGVKVQRRRVTRTDIERAVEEGAEAIQCVAYPRRLPVVGCGVPAVNMHPSPLPEGRGPSPYEWAILTGRSETAVTIHEMVERFDAGPILWHRPLAVGPTETVISLEARCRDVAAEAVVEVFRDFARLWAERRAQGPGTYCRIPRRADRMLDWSTGTEKLDRQLRALRPGGRFGFIDGRERRFGDGRCWVAQHGSPAGSVVGASGDWITVATSDGYAELELWREPLGQRLRRLAWPAYRRLARRP